MTELTNPIDTAGDAARAYTAAILDLLGDRDPLSVLSETAGRLRAAVEGRSDDVLGRPEAPGKWSPVQVVQHLADSEVAYAWRLRVTIAQDRPNLAGYDQNAWAEAFGKTARMEDALQQFEVLRAGNLRLLSGADAATLARVGLHSERGEESVAHMMKMGAGHDLAHLRQLERVLKAAG